jgi:hypothetical protein
MAGLGGFEKSAGGLRKLIARNLRARAAASTLRRQKRIEAAFIEPMQCKSVTALPAGEKWTFEIKVDGYRSIAVKRGREVALFSRRRKVLQFAFSDCLTRCQRLATRRPAHGPVRLVCPQLAEWTVADTLNGLRRSWLRIPAGPTNRASQRRFGPFLAD